METNPANKKKGWHRKEKTTSSVNGNSSSFKYQAPKESKIHDVDWMLKAKKKLAKLKKQKKIIAKENKQLESSSSSSMFGSIPLQERDENQSSHLNLGDHISSSSELLEPTGPSIEKNTTKNSFFGQRPSFKTSSHQRIDSAAPLNNLWNGDENNANDKIIRKPFEPAFEHLSTELNKSKSIDIEEKISLPICSKRSDVSSRPAFSANNNSAVDTSKADIENDEAWGFADEADKEKETFSPIMQRKNKKRINPDGFVPISSNFVKLKMNKRFRGRSGKPRKLPSYMRASSHSANSTDSLLAPSQEKNDSNSIGHSKSDGVDIISECLKIKSKEECQSPPKQKAPSKMTRQRDPGCAPIAKITTTATASSSKGTSLSDETEPPKCHQHQCQTRLLKVKKAGANKGREFYICSHGANEGRCDFFQWADNYLPTALSTFRSNKEKISIPHPSYAAYLAAKEQIKQILSAPQNEDDHDQSTSLDIKDATSDQLQTILRLYFGHKSFRSGQSWAIQNILAGESAFMILPTGTGKSLIYQFPALCLDGIVLVISPLISLMSDQFATLPPCLPGGLMSGKQSAVETATLLRQIFAHEIKILFLSPERLMTRSFQQLVRHPSFPPVAFACIDEAHCLSEWSHNFRPSYLRITTVLKKLLGAQIPATVALTATSSPNMAETIQELLEITPEQTYMESWQRPNLRLVVEHLDEDEAADRRYQHVIELCQQVYTKGAMIIYVHQKFQVERLTSLLQEHLTNSTVGSYHAGMELHDRQRIQNRFMKGTLRIIVATIAFGMGLNKSNVRTIIHFTMPSSLEHYVQEIGRAGRDGKLSMCHLLLAKKDFIRFHSLSHSNGLTELNMDAFVEVLLQQSITDVLDQKSDGHAYLDGWMDTKKIAQQTDLSLAMVETLLTLLEQQNVISLLPSLCMTLTVTIPKKTADQMKMKQIYTWLEKSSILSSDSSPPEKKDAKNRKSKAKSRVRKELYANGYLSGEIYTFNMIEMAHEWNKQYQFMNQQPHMMDPLEYVLNRFKQYQHEGLCTYQLSDYALRFRIASSPLAFQQHLPQIQQQLMEKMQFLEQQKIEQCGHAYQAFQMAVLGGGTQDKVDKKKEKTILKTYLESVNAVKMKAEIPSLIQEKSDALIAQIDAHFSDQFQVHTTDEVEEEGWFPTLKQSHRHNIAHDVELLFTQDEKIQMNLQWVTSRSLTRIFHGLTSPCFPIGEWKMTQVWGKYQEFEFGHVEQVVNDILINRQEQN